jgi:ferritin-like metal-binding protein YciE
MKVQDKDAIKTYTSDLLALETHFLNAVKKQKSSESVKDEIVIELLHELDKTVSKNTSELERHLNSLDGKTKSDIKSKLASFAGSVAGLIDNARSDTVSKIVRDNYTALSMITVGYTMLHTLALANDDEALAEISENHLKECTNMVTEISKVVPLAVANEVIDDKDKADEIGQRALHNTQQAWKPDVVNQEPELV